VLHSPVRSAPRALLAAAVAGVAVGSLLAAPAQGLPADTFGAARKVALPGGCALPVADQSWLGRATTPGPWLWTQASDVSALRHRLATGDPRSVDINKRMWYHGEWQQPIPRSLVNVVARWRVRVQKLGYHVFASRSPWAISALSDETRRIAAAGQVNRNLLRDTAMLEATATADNWLSTVTKSTSNVPNALVRGWLASYSCLYARNDSSLTRANNIAVIANASIYLAALDIARVPSLRPAAAALAKAALTQFSRTSRALMSDGGTPEGPSYWTMTARYVAAVWGTARGVYDSPPVPLPDVAKFIDYQWNSTSYDGTYLRYADTVNARDPMLPFVPAFAAHTTDDPRAAVLARDALADPRWAVQALWWPKDSAWGMSSPTKTSTRFARSGVTTLHSRWATLWLSGGNSADSHTQLDSGSVGYYRHGIQWAVDPGQGNYAAPQYFSYWAGSRRWNYFQISARGHSTIMSPTDPAGHTPLVNSQLTPINPQDNSAGVSLTSALPGASGATRVATLRPDGSATVVDSIAAAKPTAWRWQWVTDATVGLIKSKGAFTLTRNGKRVTVDLDNIPAGSSLKVVAAPSGARSPEGRALRIVVLTTAPTTRLALTAKIS